MTKKSLITIGIVIMVLGATSLYIIKVHNVFNDSLKIGKELTIVIEENEIIDFTKIVDPKMSIQGIPYPWFDMCDPRECKKLVNYLKANNLKISAGKYDINQVDNFEDFKSNLKFDKISQKDKELFKPKTDEQWNLLKNKFGFLGKGLSSADCSSGWVINKDNYYYCKKCRYLISGDPKKTDSCYCGSLIKDSDAGRLGSSLGDDEILRYKVIK